MPETNPEAIGKRLVRALSHPLRVRILEILSERAASPSGLATTLDADLGTVAYHTRMLDRCGCLELVDAPPRRGAAERSYRAAARTGLSWIPLDLDERGWEEVASILEQAQRGVRAAQQRSAARQQRSATRGRSGPRPAPAVVALATLA